MRHSFLFLIVFCFIVSSSSGNTSFKLNFSEENIPILQSNSSSVLYHSIPGEPKLPYIKYSFLLPHNVEPSTISASLINPKIKEVEGEFLIPAGESEFENGVLLSKHTEERVEEIYTNDAFFPSSYIKDIKFGGLRQFKVVTITVYPYRYNPVTKKIVKLNNGTCQLKYNIDKAINLPKCVTPQSYINELRSKVENYDEHINSYEVQSQRKNENYTIITTNAISSNLNKLEAFINSKKSRGFDVDVITEDQWGGGTGNTAADNLRSWLQDNYLTNAISYLLIIGNPSPTNGDIAMKNAYAYYAGKIAHTDFYFSELTGDWDADGDGRYGELDDLKAAGGIDAISDISVGRIPCYSGGYSAVDKILQKSIDYECAKSEDAAWRKNMLLAMDGYYGSEGPEVGEKIKDDIESATNSWDFYRIYCNYLGGPEESRLTPQAVSNAWSSGTYGIVTWLTHGSETAAMNVFSNSYVPNLNDNYPSFVIMGSCLNGKPTNSQNLAYSVLKNGGIGVIAGSETTIFKQPMKDFVGSSYNHGLIHSMTKNIAINGGYVIDAFNKARHDADMGCWKNYCCYNLYGDPTMGIEVYGYGGPTSLTQNRISKNNSKINLSGNIISIHNISSQAAKLKIFNLQGKLLYENEINNVSNRLDINKLSIGNSVIICKLIDKDYSTIKRLTLTK